MWHFFRGMICKRPVPYGEDFRWWLRGSMTSFTIVLASIPLAIFAAGFLAGRYY